ncbi:cyclic nucleotide-binding domain-containing protein [Planosporangium thailandense]|uniref:Cyclic nucleotide-binding domain-containing protein n=1 Tax=Planosporangium thailandense TaxID=765197 RepID=A0ABX0Y6L0_9ACTN|nr:cyclic nucleotide-binding domain-containing protein [Planosporangium thailandense]NJC74054.1 cyclic nucleotide-binding domain-containing protein [Planosporangium thailandense]
MSGGSASFETAYDLLAAQPFLAGLSEGQLRQLSYSASRNVLHAGARVFSEGGRADRFWLIIRGRVDLYTHVPGRGDVVVATLGPGEVLGWSWLFPPYRWHFGAVAVETTFAVNLDAEGVRRLCADDHDLGYELTLRFARVLVERLQATRVRLLDLYTVPP